MQPSARLSGLGPSSFEIHDRRKPRLAQLIQSETKGLQRRWHALLADALPRLHGRLIAPDNLPTARMGMLERSPEFLAVGMHLPSRRSAHGLFEGDVDHLALETLEVRLFAQQAVDPR